MGEPRSLVIVPKGWTEACGRWSAQSGFDEVSDCASIGTARDFGVHCFHGLAHVGLRLEAVRSEDGIDNRVELLTGERCGEILLEYFDLGSFVARTIMRAVSRPKCWSNGCLLTDIAPVPAVMKTRAVEVLRRPVP